jgi:cation transport ATPase
MTCESCVQDISGSLYKLGGIQKVEANLKDQLVTIEGTGSSHTSGPHQKEHSSMKHGTDLHGD